MGITYALIAALFLSIGNFCMRRTIDSGGTTQGYLVFQFFSAFFLMILLNPVRTGNYEWNASISILGIISGITLTFMLIALGKALETGPPGFTFATLNGSTVMPAIVMALFFGSAYGHEYTVYHGVGSILVISGLFWAGFGFKEMDNVRSWLFFITSGFVLHILFLFFMQWRALLIYAPHLTNFFRVMSPKEAESSWFIPIIYLTCFMIQTISFAFSEKRLLRFSEIGYGFFGGIGGGASTYFLIQATESASPFENAMIFPIFSVMNIIISNSWGSYLYQEKINWKASQLCMLGLFIGTVDWKILLSFFKG